MLVLSRTRNESIHLGNDIVVKVIQCGRGSVRIGIEAPDHVRILRGELLPDQCNIPLDPKPFRSPTAEVQSVA